MYISVDTLYKTLIETSRGATVTCPVCVASKGARLYLTIQDAFIVRKACTESRRVSTLPLVIDRANTGRTKVEGGRAWMLLFCVRAGVPVENYYQVTNCAAIIRLSLPTP